MDTNISLIQGERFKKYQNKIKKSIEKNEKTYTKEGFTNVFDLNNSRVSANNNQNKMDRTQLNRLKAQFDKLKQEYTDLENSLTDDMDNILGRYSEKNSYNGKNLKISNNGAIGYVTKRGDFKWYGNPDIMLNTAGKNGCPLASNLETVDIPNYSDFNTTGQTLNTSPSLRVGSSMISGQSCGYEGQNVYVTSLVPKDVKTKYIGCYADSSDSPAMTFIGGVPPITFGGIQNGNFSQPEIPNDSYQYMNTQIPGWDFNAVLINNSSAWGFPSPYPSGPQSAVIQFKQTMCQWIQLRAGTYNIQFYSCGRPNSDINNIFIRCGQSATMEENPVVTNFMPLTQWIQYKDITLNIPSDGLYGLWFIGTADDDRSCAIQDIQIIQSSSSDDTGSYTYDMCKEDAINQGYKYFALQNVNSTTGYGYCAVTNDEIRATKYGKSMIALENKPLWSSNTQGNPGCSAILNIQGSLSVVNQSGASIFNTPSASNIPSSYLGCYGDTSDRAMPIIDNANQIYNYESCEKVAKDGNYAYFGLQNSTTGQNAACGVSNDWGQVTKYGTAGNCTTLSNGIVSGGGWSNAVYGTTPSGQFYLSLEYNKTGAVGIYIWRGTAPNNNQGSVWKFETTGATDPNPNYQASKGKYGQNWMPSGSTLAPGDFIGTDNGCAYLIMQNDGNLVLYTSKMGPNCSADQNNNMGGGQNANALYSLSAVGNAASLGKIGFIDNDANLREYPSSMIGKSTNYDVIQNYDSYGNDLPNMPLTNTSLETCKTTCDSNDECNGFVYDNTNQLCYLKDNNMYPKDTKIRSTGLDLYTRTPSLINNASCPTVLNNIDSVQYDNYIKGDDMTDKYTCDSRLITDKQEAQLNKLASQIADVGDKIGQELNNLYNTNVNINTNMDTGETTMNRDFKMYYKVKQNINTLLERRTNKTDRKNMTKIKTNNMLETMLNMNDLNGMATDSDLVVLQNNYQYILWSIIAVGIVVATIHNIKK